MRGKERKDDRMKEIRVIGKGRQRQKVEREREKR
jgi:hypothetical protein